MLFGYFTLLVALIIETVGAYYSITGLAAIFSGAVIPILIMGASLEVGKVTAAVWLKLNWDRANLAYKLYLVPAVAFLMLLTSMGIFGFLSKAHSDQSLVSGDSIAKVAIYDEKIKISRENIDANRKALKQMDEAVDQVMARSTDEKGADKAVAVRRSQQKERGRLLAEIEAEQKKITTLNEERAPLAAEFRKVEAEVGPIKYIAALIYGDNPDANLLESAVRWVIILIVAVFDPLALVLILAAQQSLRWARDDKTEDQPKYSPDDGPLSEDQIQQVRASVDPHPPGWMFDKKEEHTPGEVNKHTQPVVENNTVGELSLLNSHPYLTRPFVHFGNLKPIVGQVDATADDQAAMNIDPEPVGVTLRSFTPEEMAAMDSVQTAPMKEVVEEFIDPNTRIKTFNHKLVPDNEAVLTNSDFGLVFPLAPSKGDSYVRVDAVPSKLYKYNGKKWLEIDKSTTDSYISDDYIRYLISKIRTGEYNVDDLTDAESDRIRELLKA